MLMRGRWDSVVRWEEILIEASAKAHQAAHDAKRHVKPWVVWLARLGYASRGVVYAVVGILGFLAAVSPGGRTTNTQGALYTIARQPFGRTLLGVVGVGLLGYALWRLIQAVLDPEGKGTSPKGIAKRASYAISALAYGGLGLSAFKIVSGLRTSQGSSQQDWTATLLAQPFGQWLVGIVGLVVIASALNTLYIAYGAKFRDKLKTGEMSQREDVWITRAGRAGFGARGVVWLIIGWFFVRAALHSNARESGGLANALDALARQSYGSLLLGIVATGLVAYGAYALAEARYRRIYV
jgi:hypothetical protein